MGAVRRPDSLTRGSQRAPAFPRAEAAPGLCLWPPLRSQLPGPSSLLGQRPSGLNSPQSPYLEPQPCSWPLFVTGRRCAQEVAWEACLYHCRKHPHFPGPGSMHWALRSSFRATRREPPDSKGEEALKASLGNKVILPLCHLYIVC